MTFKSSQPLRQSVNPIDRIDFNFVHNEVTITKRDGSVERLSFAKMEQDTKMSLIPLLAVVRTVNEI